MQTLREPVVHQLLRPSVTFLTPLSFALVSCARSELPAPAALRHVPHPLQFSNFPVHWFTQANPLPDPDPALRHFFTSSCSVPDAVHHPFSGLPHSDSALKHPLPPFSEALA